MNKNYLVYSLEDDLNISHMIKLALSCNGYNIKTFNTYKDFLVAFNQERPNMVLLDLMLPEITGEEILKSIRSDEENDNIQVIIISAKNLTINKIEGFNLGADDYITKPFDVLELISRVNAHSRRFFKEETKKIRNLTFDLDNNCIYSDDEVIKFTKGEVKILFTLYKHKGEVVSRDNLFLSLWGENNVFETRILDMHVKEIRKKLKENSDLIETIYGVGYKLKNE